MQSLYTETVIYKLYRRESRADYRNNSQNRVKIKKRSFQMIEYSENDNKYKQQVHGLRHISSVILKFRTHRNNRAYDYRPERTQNGV